MQDSPVNPRVAEATILRKPSIRLTIPLVLFAVAGLGALGATSGGPTDAVIAWASLGLTAYLSCLFVTLFFNSKSFGLYEIRLGGWFLGYAIVAFGLATFSIIGRQIESGYAVDKTKVPQALSLIALAFTLWAIGYALGRERIFQMPFQWGKETLTSRLSGDVRSANALLLVFSVGVIADILTAVLLGRYGYLGDSPMLTVGAAAWYTQPLAIASGLKSAALFGLSVRVFVSRTDRFSKHLLPVLVLALALSMVTGMKQAFVTALIGVAIPFLIGYGRRRILWIAAAVLVFVFVVTPIVAGIRQDVSTGNGRLGILASLSLSVSKLFGGSYFTADPNSPPTITTTERLREIDNLAIIIQKTPGEIPYRPISEVALAPFTGLVPRLLWPDKPVRISGYEFYRDYYGGGGVSASAITLEGSLYLYGGTAVLAIGMFLVGLLMRAVEGALNAKNDLHGALLFMVVAEVVVKQEADVASFLAGIVVFVLSWLLGAHMIFRNKTNLLATRRSSMAVTLVGGQLVRVDVHHGKQASDAQS